MFQLNIFIYKELASVRATREMFFMCDICNYIIVYILLVFAKVVYFNFYGFK